MTVSVTVRDSRLGSGSTWSAAGSRRDLLGTSTRRVSKQKQKGRNAMSKRFRPHLVALLLVIVLVALARYFGWLSDAPPLIAPGIR